MASSKAPITAPPEPWRPKAIVFDLLTALLDSWTLWDACTPTGTQEEGRKWRARYLEITFGAGMYVPYEELVRQAARDVGLPETAPQKLLEGWSTGLKPWTEVSSILKGLKAQGYRLGVVTNCSVALGRDAVRQVESCVRVSGVGEADSVESIFDTIVTAEESGYYKPCRQAYQAIMTAMELRAEEILFVAGSAGDVEGATQAGMKVVWHNKVGLAKKGEAVPLREARSLDAALDGFL